MQMHSKCIASALQMHNGNALKIRHLRKNPAKTPRKSPIIRKLMKTNPHLIFPAKCKSNTAFSLIVTALCVIPLVFSPFLATLYPTHNSKTIMDDDYFPVLKSPELLGHQFFPCAIDATGRGVSRETDAISSWIIRHNSLSLCRLTYVKSKELRSILSEVSESHRTTYRHCTPVEICNGNPALGGVRRRERQCRFSIAHIFHIRLTMKELPLNKLKPLSQGFACRYDAGAHGSCRAHIATFSRFFLQNCEILPTFAMLTVDRAIILFRRAIGQFAHIRASYCPTEDNGGCRIRKIKSKFPAEWRLSSVSSVYGGRFLYSPNYQSFNAYR